jgi:transposase
MMGQQAKQTEWWSDSINVFARIPDDHLLRRLNRILDLDFVRGEVVSSYGRNGQVSVDPVVIMKMMLLLFLDDVKSERELMRIIPLRIDYLYFLGFGLEDAIPNHSVLSKARNRWGKEVFERLFARTVEQCLRAGLVDGSKVHVDASLIRADASLNCVVVIERTMAKLEEPMAKEPDPAASSSDDDEPRAGGPINESHIVQTDPDATVVRHRSGKSLPSYKNHRALDDKAGVITALKTTTGCVADGHELMGLLQDHHNAVGRRPRAAIADSAYGTTANLIALAQHGIRAHVSDLRSRLNNVRQEGIYPPEAFSYDAATDAYFCPAGEVLVNHHFHAKRGYYEYRTAPGVCASCALASQCTRAKYGRTLKRYPAQEQLDRARRQSHGPAARRDRKRRQWFQERNFGEAAVEHGFKRARWRGLWRQEIQDLLIAAIQNLKIYLRKTVGGGGSDFGLLCGRLRGLLRFSSSSSGPTNPADWSVSIEFTLAMAA